MAKKMIFPGDSIQLVMNRHFGGISHLSRGEMLRSLWVPGVDRGPDDLTLDSYIFFFCYNQ
jgi:hypothetical protein